MRVYPKDETLKRAMIEFAKFISRASACDRASHGCVLTTPEDMQVISYGYNGPAKRLENHCKRPEEVGNCGCVHAEQNAIAKASPGEKWAFITMQPCERCAALLINADVTTVYYGTSAHRRIEGGLELLNEAGVVHYELR